MKLLFFIIISLQQLAFADTPQRLCVAKLRENNNNGLLTIIKMDDCTNAFKVCNLYRETFQNPDEYKCEIEMDLPPIIIEYCEVTASQDGGWGAHTVIEYAMGPADKKYELRQIACKRAMNECAAKGNGRGFRYYCKLNNM